MIDKLTYEEISNISNALSKEATIIKELGELKNIQALLDFAATVDGYSKFLNSSIDIHKSVELALKDFKPE